MKSLLTLLLVLVALSGCEKNVPIIAEDLPESSDLVKASEAPKLDFGDVEQGVHLSLTVPEDKLPIGATTDQQLTSGNKRLTLMTVDIAGPAPTQLPLHLEIDTRTDFSANPIAIRGNVYREIENGKREAIFSFHTLVDESILPKQRAAQLISRFPYEFETDGMAGLSEMPPTMLLFVTAEAVMLPSAEGKDTIDPATVVGTDIDSGALLSNPIRINFTPMAAAAAEALPTADTPPEPDAVATTPEIEATPLGAGLPAAEAPATEVPAAE